MLLMVFLLFITIYWIYLIVESLLITCIFNLLNLELYPKHKIYTDPHLLVCWVRLLYFIE